VSYGYFHFGADEPRAPFPLNFEQALPIQECVKCQDESFWIFAVNEKFSVSASIRDGGGFVILQGQERTSGRFARVERHWDPEFRESYVCWSNSPDFRWVIGVNAFDCEGGAQRA